MPTKEWLPTSITGVMGSYVAWNTVPIDAEAMIDAMVVVLAAQHKSTTLFDMATIFTMASPTAPAIPRIFKTYTTAGSNAIGGPDKATQLTLNGRSVLFGHWKIVMLDVPVGTSNFNKVLPSAFPATFYDILLEFGLPSNAWAARDGSQALAAISGTITLNERLRKEYRMA
jgi:hypothetical protein